MKNLTAFADDSLDPQAGGGKTVTEHVYYINLYGVALMKQIQTLPLLNSFVRKAMEPFNNASLVCQPVRQTSWQISII